VKSPEVAREAWINGALREARVLGYLDDNAKVDLSGRVPSKLLKAARQLTGIRSDTKLLVLALSMLATHDDFAERLLKRKGTVDPSSKLEF
jgi:hypothetical protein